MFRTGVELPKRLLDYRGKRSAFRVSGGLGDALICAGVVAGLSGYKALAVKPNQVEVISTVVGIDQVIPISDFKSTFQQGFDCVGNFDEVFTLGRELIPGCYHEAAAQRVGGDVSVARLDIPINRKVDVCIHAGSSNPNRRWQAEKWYNVANSLEQAGRSVGFLGTEDEPGYESAAVCKLSRYTESIVGQAAILKGAKLFLGNDSGFCHIAGCFQTPGWVVLTNTSSSVISRYALQPYDCFEQLGPPTRSLNPADHHSVKCRDCLGSEKLCRLLGIPHIPFGDFENLTKGPFLTIMGDGERSEYFRKNSPWPIGDGQVVVFPDGNRIEISGTLYPFVGGPLDIPRYVREVTQGVGISGSK